MGTVSEADVHKILNKCGQAKPSFLLHIETLAGSLQMELPRDFADIEGLARWIVQNVQGVESSSYMQAAIEHYMRTQLKTLFSWNY